MKKFWIYASLFVLLSAHGSLAFETEGPENISYLPLETASVIIEIRDIVHQDDSITFTIPENARSQETSANSVRLSAVALGNKDAGDLCPVLNSIYMKKDINSYNPLSGRASVTATFSNSRLAELAADNGCLLIDDID